MMKYKKISLTKVQVHLNFKSLGFFLLILGHSHLANKLFSCWQFGLARLNVQKDAEDFFSSFLVTHILKFRETLAIYKNLGSLTMKSLDKIFISHPRQ